MTQHQTNIEEDNWIPDIDCKDTIIEKVQVNYNDKHIKKQISKFENEPFDPSYIISYTQSQEELHKHNEEMQDLEDEQEDQEQYMSKTQRDLLKQQLMEEQIYFDPLQDNKNEKWVDKNLKCSQFDNGLVLSCPHCFIQLCYDSQRHEIYKNQYRALMVCNCQVNCEKVVQPQKEKGANSKSALPMEIYFSVNCASCQTNVAVYELGKKIYHFYDVVPSFG